MNCHRPHISNSHRETHLRDLAACARVLHQLFCASETSEGAGKAGRSSHPQPRVQNKKAHERSHHRFAEFTRPSLRNGFNGLLRALPGDRALLPPSSSGNLRKNLTPASGRQDHTTSPSASASFVELAIASLMLPRPSHPVPNVRDDRETPPLCGTGWREF